MDDERPGLTGRHEPIWLDTTPQTNYESLAGSAHVDTAVVGGGIAGITTAWKLARAGQTVAVLERDRILNGVTGHTTAKVTSQHGLIYDHLVDYFGEAKARQYADANEAAIDDVEETVEALGVDCGFQRAPAYTYVESAGDRAEIRGEVEAAHRLGLPVEYVDETELPYDVSAAVRFDDQAYFHPRKYLLELARRIPERDGHVFEHTTVTDVSDGDPCRVETDDGFVTADDVVVATHFPVSDDALYFARMSPKRSYVVAARLADPEPEGMYYYPKDPYFSVRPHASTEEPIVLLGGQNHRTGHGGSTTERYRRLERQAREHFDVESIEYRWSTQDYVSVDRVPFIGTAAPHLSNVHVATGFGGWGMTGGTVAGMVLSDRILGRANPWADVFSPTRLKPGASAKSFAEHNAHAAKHYVEDFLSQAPDLDLSSLAPGEAEVFDDRDEPVAAYRDRQGQVHAVSAICTHMGCQVEWNDGEESWDCPCHGSRFGLDGRVLDTPAVDDLDTHDVGPSERDSDFDADAHEYEGPMDQP